MSDYVKKDKKAGKDDKKKDKKDKTETDRKKADLIRVVQKYPIIWKRVHNKDSKEKDNKTGHGLDTAWNQVATEANIPAKEAEKYWSKVVKQFEDDYHEFKSVKSGQQSSSKGMTCENCKFWKALDFYRAHLDSQYLGTASSSASHGGRDHIHIEGIIVNEVRPQSAPVNMPNPGGPGWNVGLLQNLTPNSSAHVTAQNAILELNQGILTKEKFLQYLSTILNSVPSAKLAHCEKQLLEVAVANSVHM